jgi:hypothetical protein
MCLRKQHIVVTCFECGKSYYFVIEINKLGITYSVVIFLQMLKTYVGYGQIQFKAGSYLSGATVVKLF